MNKTISDEDVTQTHKYPVLHGFIIGVSVGLALGVAISTWVWRLVL